MILSDKQLQVSRRALAKLEAALDAARDQSDSPDWVRQIECDALESQIEDVRAEMTRYEDLREGRVDFTETCSLEELPTRLVEIRIARKLTQTELARELGLKPQQIQRYEASRYSGANLARLTDIARTLLGDRKMPIHHDELGALNSEINPSIDALERFPNKRPREFQNAVVHKRTLQDRGAYARNTPVIYSRYLRWQPKHEPNFLRYAT